MLEPHCVSAHYYYSVSGSGRCTSARRMLLGVVLHFFIYIYHNNPLFHHDIAGSGRCVSARRLLFPVPKQYFYLPILNHNTFLHTTTSVSGSGRCIVSTTLANCGSYQPIIHLYIFYIIIYILTFTTTLIIIIINYQQQ